MIKRYKIKKFRRINGGFTLVETLVAVSIFSVSVVNLMVVLGGGISNTNYAKQKMVSSYLAQEGIEYVRNLRDTYVLYDGSGAQNGWSQFMSKLTGASCQLSNGCYFDDQGLNFGSNAQPMTAITMAACGSSCPALRYDRSTIKYGYASGVSTTYVRKIKITSISADETKVFSTVSWSTASSSFSITFSESVFNWAE